MVCGGLPDFHCFHYLSSQILVVICGDLWWFAVVCGGLGWFGVVCDGLRWFVLQGLWCHLTEPLKLASCVVDSNCHGALGRKATIGRVQHRNPAVSLAGHSQSISKMGGLWLFCILCRNHVESGAEILAAYAQIQSRTVH